MSEEKGELDKPLSSELPSFSDTPPKEFAPLERIEERLANANSPDEILLWTKVRGEIIRQNEFIKDGQYQRFLRRFSLIRKTALSVIAITIGIGLIIGGSSVLGASILGVVFYELVPDYLKNVVSSKTIFEENDETKSFQKLEDRSLIIGLIISSIAGILVFLITRDETVSEIDRALLFLVGMTTIAALEAFHNYFSDMQNKNLDRKDARNTIVCGDENSTLQGHILKVKK